MNSGNETMKNLIPTMNKIFDTCTKIGANMQFDFPHIAVVGSQSAGKSSVLDSFVGSDIFPRGDDIVTRCPLILQLRNDTTEYAEFMHKSCKGKKFTDFTEIPKEIERETQRNVGKKVGVSNVPINLHIHSPNTLDLTVIDLPGMVEIPIGDAPADIGQQIEDIVLEHISKENCLILAVSPANVSLAASVALRMAKKVDPRGDRTIGVITKLDIMGQGTNARDVLLNKQFPLRLGYVGVVNRSQKDIDEKKSILAAMKDEREFFEKNKYYQDVADRMGTPYLQKMLTQQLTEHIREKLPSLNIELEKKMISLEKEVEEFNVLHSDNLEAMKAAMLEIIRQVQSDFNTTMGGLRSKDIQTNELNSGAIICELMHNRLKSEIMNIPLRGHLMTRDIRNAIINHYGFKLVSFPPFEPFEYLTKKQIERLKEPILRCIDLVIGELTSAVQKSTQCVSKYPALRANIESKINSFIVSNEPKNKVKILSLIEIECAHINTTHKDFKSIFNTPQHNGGDEHSMYKSSDDDDDFLKSLNENHSDGGVKTSNQNEVNDNIDPAYKVDDVYKAIDNYMQIVKHTMSDMVPKAITLYIINELAKYMDKELQLKFLSLSHDEYKKIFASTTAEQKKHDETLKTYEACKSALKIIRGVQTETSQGIAN